MNYHPLFDGPVEPFGLAMDANGNIKHHDHETPTIHDNMTTFEIYNAQSGLARSRAARIIDSMRELPLQVHHDAKGMRDHVFQLLETLAEFETASRAREAVTLEKRNNPDSQRFHLYNTQTGAHAGAFECFDTIRRNCKNAPAGFAAVFRTHEGFLRVRCIKTGLVLSQPESALILKGIVRTRKRRGMQGIEPAGNDSFGAPIAD